MEKSPHFEKGIQPASVLKSSSTSLSLSMDYECSTGQCTPKLSVWSWETKPKHNF